MITLKPQIHLKPSHFTSSPSSSSSITPILTQIRSQSRENPTKSPTLKNSSASSSSFKKTHTENPRNLENPRKFSKKSRALMWGAASIGAAILLMGLGEEEKALALGPGGPLMEDFWENMRRYGIFALTVSTGALYAVFQPIFELLRNPISAILVFIVVAGGFYIMTQVLSAMLGIS